MERVHYMPGEVDVSGMRPEMAQVFRDRRLPFDEDDPLIFHVLTTLEEHGAGEEQVLDAMATGAVLMPSSEVAEKWGGGRGKIFARDRIAGDGEYLFMTPCGVFSGVDTKSKYAPAVAFRLSYVIERAEIAFRVHDLEPSYVRAEQLAGDPELHDEFPEEFGSMDELDAWQREEYEEAIASSVVEQLEAIAECGTQYDSAKAQELVLLYARLCGAFRDTRHGQVSPENPERLEIFESAQMLFPECIQELDDDAESWLDDLFVREIVEDLVESWNDLFAAPSAVLLPFPHTLLFQSSLVRPELMVKGALPLCDAEFFRDGMQAWRRVPEEVCRSGRKA